MTALVACEGDLEAVSSSIRHLQGCSTLFQAARGQSPSQLAFRSHLLAGMEVEEEELMVVVAAQLFPLLPFHAKLFCWTFSPFSQRHSFSSFYLVRFCLLPA